ncbi:MAG: OmpH family outer membrane protein [Desulfopila sp.]
MNVKRLLVALILVGTLFLLGAGQVLAESKFAVMNVQRVITQCDAGKKAKTRFEARMKDLQGKFKGEQDQLVALQNDIEKKSSAWSEQKKIDKVRELQKNRRDLQDKTDDANLELKQLQEKELQPILKALEKVVTDYGKKNGYMAIFDIKGGVIYYENSIDVTDDIIKGVNSAMK